MSLNLDYKKIYLEVHTSYRNRLRNLLPIRSFKYFIPRHFYGWYLDWWVNWISASPIKIKYKNDDNLLFSHPLAFCNIVINNKRYLLGFDLWDKYPLYASHTKNRNAKKRWQKCEICFKTQYFDAKSPYRYRAPLSYVQKDEDEGREKAEEAYFKENVFPAGMPLTQGRFFLHDKYKTFRSKNNNFNVRVSGAIKEFSPLRNEMVKRISSRYNDSSYIKSYLDYLKILGQTKVCIDLPSNSRVTFRSCEALSMGALLIGPPTCNIYPQDFKISDCMIFSKSDLSDFIEKVEYYISHDKNREDLVEYAMNMWDRVMSPERLSEYWIKTAFDYLGII